MRTARKHALAAASTLLAALALTACQGNDAAAPAADKPAAAPSAQGAADNAPGSDGSTDQAPQAPSTPRPEKPAPRREAPKPVSKPRPKPDTTPVTCTGANVKVRATVVARPLDHLLVTATNTGSRPCYAYYAPALRFGDAQAAARVDRDSVPQAVVTLEPGESAYAGVRTSRADGGAGKGYTATSLEVWFTGRDDKGSEGPAARPALPAAGVYVDPSVTVSYWQTSMDAALD
ncbi:DUF4232 domain-containing protein [Streptomyces sp. NPDC001941]|uniref:DUF4232 domain-containing protein n=1 Tax=Streptomyces sp. NPDC001941 TaxID=3154659 RepID=UPI00332DFD6B